MDTSAKTTNLPHLDGWRGMAIVAALISHFGIHYSRTWMGTLGVQLFSVLSGYLMSNLLVVREVPLQTFFLRLIKCSFSLYLNQRTMLIAATRRVRRNAIFMGLAAKDIEVRIDLKHFPRLEFGDRDRLGMCK